MWRSSFSLQWVNRLIWSFTACNTTQGPFFSYWTSYCCNNLQSFITLWSKAHTWGRKLRYHLFTENVHNYTSQTAGGKNNNKKKKKKIPIQLQIRHFFNWKVSQQAHNPRMTSYQRRCDVIASTLIRRHFNIVCPLGLVFFSLHENMLVPIRNAFLRF